MLSKASHSQSSSPSRWWRQRGCRRRLGLCRENYPSKKGRCDAVLALFFCKELSFEWLSCYSSGSQWSWIIFRFITIILMRVLFISFCSFKIKHFHSLCRYIEHRLLRIEFHFFGRRLHQSVYIPEKQKKIFISVLFGAWCLLPFEVKAVVFHDGGGREGAHVDSVHIEVVYVLIANLNGLYVVINGGEVV